MLTKKEKLNQELWHWSRGEIVCGIQHTRSAGGLHLDKWKILRLAALLPIVAAINYYGLNE